MLASIRHGRPLAIAGPDRVAEIGGAVDADAVDASGARHGGEIRIIGLARLGMLEVGGEFPPAEIAALQAADRRIGVVVPHHPHDRDVVFDGRAEHVGVHEEGAVAAHRHAWAVGRRELGAEHAADAEPHRAEPHRADQGIGPARLAELDQPVVVDADVADEDGVLRQRPVDLARRPLRMDGRGVVVKAGRDEGVPFPPPAGDGGKPALARLGDRAGVRAAVELGVDLPQEGADIGHEAERHRIVARDLVRIDVDMDQLGRRDGEGVAGDPGAGGAVVEAHAERQQHVGLARGVIGLIRPVARHEPEMERMAAVDGALAARRIGDRDREALGEAQKVAGGAAVFDALADQDDGPLGREQHVDRALDALRIGAGAAGDVGVPFLRPRRLRGGGLLEDVERHVEHDRAGAARHHRLPGLPDGERHHVAAGRLEDALAIGLHRRGKIRLVVPVELLEGAAVELAGRHVAGDGEERHRIEIGVGEADGQVGRARPARREGRCRLAADAVIHVGHEAGHALVPDRDGLDVVGALVEGVDEADIAVAAQAEGVGHLLADQVIDDDLAAVEHVVAHRSLVG